MIALAAVSLVWLGLGFYAGRKDADMDARAEAERRSRALAAIEQRARENRNPASTN